LAQRQKYYCGPGAPRKIVDGTESTPPRTALVSLTLRASPIPIPRYWVTRGCGVWARVKAFCGVYTVQSRSLQAEGGMPVMVALTPCSDWLSLSTRSSHGVLVCVWRNTTCGRQLGVQVCFLPILMRCEMWGEGVVHRNECGRGQQQCREAEQQQRDFPKISRKGTMNHPSANGQSLGHATPGQAPTHRSHRVRKRKHWMTVLPPSRQGIVSQSMSTKRD